MKKDANSNKVATAISCVFVMLVAAGCASTSVVGREKIATGPLPRPATIWVYDFVASADKLPPGSTLAGEDLDTTPQTPDEIAAGEQLGIGIAAELVQQINNLGMNAAQAVPETTPQINDIVIRGYLLSVNKGSAVKRVAIGFGSGASELRTMVEGYQMTDQGLRKLGVGTIQSGGSKGPGAALGVATFLATANPAGLIISSGMKVYGEASGKSTIQGRSQATAKEIADVLKKRFQEEGWIN
jgi:hypothetical protein